MSITRNFNLYLNAGHSIPLVINASQYDQGEIWNFTIYNSDGTQYTPTDASIVGKKSDGNLIAIAATVSDGIVSVTETEQMTAAAGKNVFELQLDSDTHGTANFVVLVEEDPTADGVVSESDLSLIRQAISGSMSDDVISALLTCFAHVAWADANGQTYYNALDAALLAPTGISLDQSTLSFTTLGATQQLTATTIPAGASVTWASSDTSIATVDSTGLVTSVAEGSVTITATAGNYSATCSVTVALPTLTSISAVYTQSGDVYESTSLDDLKADLVVTAVYDDSTTVTLSSSDYTLSGTLEVGTSTVTVTYGAETTTFTVTVTTDPTIVYQLTNTTFDGTNSVDTELTPFSTDSDWTIAVDFENTITSSSAIFRLFGALNTSSPWAGISIQRVNASSTKWQIQWMTAKYEISSPSILTNFACKLVLTHTAGSGTMEIAYVAGSDSRVDTTLSDTYQTVSTNLTIGYAGGDLWEGVMNEFTLYSRVFTADEITAFLGA